MLTAQREEYRSQPVLSPQKPGGFGKVLNSIQGLQQRLDEFSVDQLTSANDNVRTIILRLSDVQNKLNSFAAIQDSLNAAERAVKGASTEGPDLSKLLMANKALHIQTVVTARNLIRFPRFHKASKDAAKSASLTVTGKEIEEGISTPALLPAIINEPATKASVAQPSICPPAKDIFPLFAPQDVSPNANSTMAAPLSHPSLIHNEQSPVVPAAMTVDTTAESSKLESQANETQSCPQTSEAPPQAPLSPWVKQEQTPQPNMALVPPSDSIDQKLLNDLIENYGEFAKTPNLPVAVELVEEPKATFNNFKSPSGSPARDSETARNRVPSRRKDGELDRKLKKLIKDYGEYDLYPRHSTINLKSGVIAAFLLLGVVFSGFYFFAIPKSVHMPHVSTAPQSSINANGGTTKAGTQIDATGTTKAGTQIDATGTPNASRQSVGSTSSSHSYDASELAGQSR